MIRNAGAKEVHFRVASPPVVSPCFYGMDFPSHEELMANQHNGDIEEMRRWLDVDSLAYLSIDGLAKAVSATNASKNGYCNACFSSEYPVPIQLGIVKEENDW